jgi:hypothetical protein
MAPAAADLGQVADAVAGYLALREFREGLYRCLTARPDALFELTDAILCADHAVTSLVQLSLVPEFRRGHGALYAALADGQIDEEALAALLTGTLPALVDGQDGRTWVSGHDKIDYGLLEQVKGSRIVSLSLTWDVMAVLVAVMRHVRTRGSARRGPCGVVSAP